MEQAIQSVQSFFKHKDVVISAHRYGIDAMGAMAQGLFASLLIGTIIKTLGQQLGLAFLVTTGGYAAAVAGPAMAASIGYALHAPQLVLFSLIAVGGAANELGGAGGPLAVYLIAIIAAEVGKLVSKETKIDILVTPAVTILVGVGLSALFAPSIGAGAECLIQVDGIVNTGHIVAAQVILHLAQCAGEGILRAVGLQVAGQRHPQQQHAGRVRHRNALGNDGAQTVRGLFDLQPAACGVQRGHRSHLIQRLQSSRVQQPHAGVCEGHAVKQLRQSCHLCLQLVKGVVLFHVAS